jgi:hypothetical protein
MPVAFEHFTHRADAAIHHVGRRDDVDAGFRLRARLFDQDFDVSSLIT